MACCIIAITADGWVVMLSQAAVTWLENRGLSGETAARYGLESCEMPGGGDGIMAPSIVGTEIVNRKYRSLDGKRFSQDKGGQQVFWNYNAITDPTLSGEPLIVCEGELDTLAALDCGFPRSVSVPSGAPAEEISDRPSKAYQYLDHARAALKDVREIILAVDGDGPGVALYNDLVRRLGAARCKFVVYPKGCKDLGDALKKYGRRGVTETIGRARWARVDGIYRMSELPPYPDRVQYETFDFMWPHYRLRMGDFCVVTGIPGSGKTTWVNDLVCRLAGTHKWTIAVCSFEQHPQADHRRALREWYLRGPERMAGYDRLREADRWIDDHFVFVLPHDDDLATIEWVMDKCAAAVIRHNARVVVIDPWNELDHDRPTDMSLTEYTGRAIKEFKRLARSMDIHVIVVAHPAKMTGGDEPGLYSISDSAHWANKPDVGIVIHKSDDGSDFSECIVKKSRYHDMIGKPGRKKMVYSTVTRRFSEVDEAAWTGSPAE